MYEKSEFQNRRKNDPAPLRHLKRIVMQNIDQNIFDLICRFEEGALSESERKSLSQRLKTDKIYQQHRDYYHMVTKAIIQGTHEMKKEQLKEWHRQDFSMEEAAAYDDLLEKERSIAKRNYRFFLAGIFLLVAVGFFLLGRFSKTPAPTNSEPIEKRLTPNDNDEGEVPVASTSNSKSKTINSYILQVDKNKVISKEKIQRKISLKNHSELFPAYQFHNNQLQLYATTLLALETADIEWITLEENGGSSDYLKLNDQYYSLIPTPTKRHLQEETNDATLSLLK